MATSKISKERPYKIWAWQSTTIIKSSEDFNPTSMLHNQPLCQLWCASHINTTLQTSLAFTVEMMWDKIKHPHTIKIDSSNPATISTTQLTSIIKIIEWYNKLGKDYNRLPCGNTKMIQWHDIILVKCNQTILAWSYQNLSINHTVGI